MAVQKAYATGLPGMHDLRMIIVVHGALQRMLKSMPNRS